MLNKSINLAIPILLIGCFQDLDISNKDVVSSREFLRSLRENSEKNISKLN